MSYKIIKIIDQKEHRTTLLIHYQQRLAILKKIKTKQPSIVARFHKERTVLSAINKPYVPKVYAQNETKMIVEYFPTKQKGAEAFAQHMTPKIQQTILNQLIDLQTTPLSSIQASHNQPLLSLYRLVAKSILTKSFHLFYLRALLRCTLLYLKNIPLFRTKIATKGDFTEVNILIGENSEVKFIDFDNYHSQGSWVEDASYLLLHQDVPIDTLSWQVDFFRDYLKRVHHNFLPLNWDYVHFWLLSSALKQHAIRYQQYQKKRIDLADLEAKAEHLSYFLDPKKSHIFFTKVRF